MRIKMFAVPCLVFSSLALSCAAGVGSASAASADPLGGGSASAAHMTPAVAHTYLLNINPGGFTYNLTVSGHSATSVNTVSGDVEHYTKKGKKHVTFTEVGGGNCVLTGVKTHSGYNTAVKPGVAVCGIGTYSWYATKA